MGGSGSKDQIEVPEYEEEHNPKESDVKKTRGDREDIAKLKFEDGANKGPVHNRSCTDIICCLIFIAFLGGMGAATVYGYAKGDPGKLVVGWDSDGNGCGYSENTLEYPYLYWPLQPDPTIVLEVANGDYSQALEILNGGVCVKSCPEETTDVVECFPTSMMTSSNDAYAYKNCEYYPNVSRNFLTGNVSSMGNPFRFKTETLVGAYCLPGDDYVDEETKKLFIDAFMENMYGEAGARYINDIFTSWVLILVAFVVACLISYAYLWLVRCMGGTIIWLSLLAIEITLIVGGLWTYYYYRTTYDVEDSTYKWLTIGAWCAWALAVIFFFIMCCCWGTIQMGIAVFKSTAKFMHDTMKILLLPLVTWAVSLVWICVWLTALAFIWSIGEVTQRTGDYAFMTEIMWAENVRYILLYHLFGLLWVNAWIIGACQFTVACSACLWYYEQNSDAQGKGTVGRSIWWCFRYHMGSIAFGSCLIAICQLIRLIFEYYRRTLGMADQRKKLVKILLCISGYCLWFLEKCIKFITKTAYIQIALTNKFFCKAAWQGFVLILKHAHKVAIAFGIGYLFSLVGVATICGLTTFASYLFITNTTYLAVEPVAPCVCIGVISAFIGYQALSVFTFSADAILQAFLMDEELGFAGNARPEAMQKFAEDVKKKKETCC